MYLSSLCAILFSIIIVIHANTEYPQLASYKIENNGLDKSSFRYELSDGTYNEQAVNALNSDKENKQLYGKGSYSYQDNGIITSVTYDADDNGFKPQVRIFNIFLQEQHLPVNAIITLQGGIG